MATQTSRIASLSIGDAGPHFGICEHMGSHEGFLGEYKVLFEDFQVNEIMEDGTVVNLSEITRNPGGGTSEVGESEARLDPKMITPEFRFLTNTVTALNDAGCTNEDVERLRLFLISLSAKEFLQPILERDVEGPPHRTDNYKLRDELNFKYPRCHIGKSCWGDDAKQQRKHLHEVVRTHLPFLASEAYCQAIDDPEPPQPSPRLITVFPKVEFVRDLLGPGAFKQFILASEKEGQRTASEGGKSATLELQNKQTEQAQEEKPSTDLVSPGFNPLLPQNKTEPASKEPFKRVRPDTGGKAKRDRKKAKKSVGQPSEFKRLMIKCADRWDNERGKFIRFHLYKANRDLQQVLFSFARRLNRNVKDFSYAGIKDRRGITVQRISAFKVSKHDLLRCVNSKGCDWNVSVSDFQYSRKRLQLGELLGNQFRLVIRNVATHAPKIPDSGGASSQRAPLNDIVHEAMTNLQQHGFLNYYGAQRFGSHRTHTHVIGLALLGKQWELAVKLILSNLPECQADIDVKTKNSETSNVGKDESPSIIEKASTRDSERAETQCDTTNFSEMLKRIPRNRMYCEGTVVSALAKRKTWMEALLALPRNMTKLYIHSIQSLIFNIVLTERVRVFGHVPRVGDLYLKHAHKQSTVDEDLELEDVPLLEEGDDAETVLGQMPVDVITSEEQAASVDVCQVVLPLPGDAVQYPEYLRETYEKVIRSLCSELRDHELRKFGLSDSANNDSITLESFTHSNNGFGTLSGGYRPIVVKPLQSFQYHLAPAPKISEEAKNVIPMLASDLDYLQGLKVCQRDALRNGIENSISKSEKAATVLDRCNVPECKQLIFLQCSLPKSSYVTMALRELFKS